MWKLLACYVNCLLPFAVLQENILMGENWEPSRYQVAADVSCLLPDLAMWPNGDATEIGDRGVTLSGGQKARVSIARSVYSDADVYLMDDPLAAVDTHVGRSLFERCIRGVLRDKTVILVSFCGVAGSFQQLVHSPALHWLRCIGSQARWLSHAGGFAGWRLFSGVHCCLGGPMTDLVGGWLTFMSGVCCHAGDQCAAAHAER